MIGRNAHSRRADEFDAALAGRTLGTSGERYAELLELVGAMRSMPAPVARPEFVSDLRAQLVATAEAMPARRTDEATALRLTPKQRRGSRERRMAALLGGFAVVAASGSMAVASQNALPGDVLYPVKRAIENVHANLQTSAEAKASVLFDNANTRLSEVEQLSQRHDAGDAPEISSTLQAFKSQTSQATSLALSDYSNQGDDDALDEVHSFASSSMDRIKALDDVLPTAARPALIAAAQTVRQVDSAAVDACPSCTDGQITPLPEFAWESLTTALKNGSHKIHGATPTTTAGARSQGGANGDHTSGSSTAPSGTPTSSSGGSSSQGGGSTGVTVPPPVAPTGTSDPTGKDGIVSGTLNGIRKSLLGDGSGDNTTSSGSSGSSQPADPKPTSVVKSLTNLLGLG